MKIAFFGTGKFSKNILEGVLFDGRVEVNLVVSQPDKVVGRKRILQKTPVKLLAEEKKIEVLQPEKLLNNTEFLDYLDSLELDFILVVAYGKIVPVRILNAAKYGCINLHGSILPLYRGASPIQEAIKNGDTKTGLTVMYMSKKMDQGDILKIKEVDIEKDDKTSDIFKKFESFGSKLALDTLKEVASGKLEGIPQDNEKSTYCSKINKEDGEIDFSKSAESIYNKFRSYYTWPGIFTYYNGKKFQIEECSFDNHPYTFDDDFTPGAVCEREHDGKRDICILCNNGILILKQVKLAGKKSMDILSFINGNRDFLDYNF